MNSDDFNKYNGARLNDRKIDELIGLCKGIIADGAIAEAEAEFLQQWLLNNKEVKDHWPANVIYSRIARMLLDNKMDDEEERELLVTLLDVTGGPTIQKNINSMSSTLPLCNPAPTVIFENRLFCMTGKFLVGTRAQVEATIESLGGMTTSNPTMKTHYLVIGSVGSADWVHSTHGRKIEEAIKYREKGKPISIISEEHWCSFLP